MNWLKNIFFKIKRGRRSILTSIFLYSITILIFYLLLRKIDLHKSIYAIKSVNHLAFIYATFISILINVFVSSDLRRKLLCVLGYRLSLKESILLKMGSLPFKVIPVFKETGLAQAIYLNKHHKMPVSLGILATILANILSIIAITIFFIIGFIFYRQHVLGVLDRRYILIIFFIFTLFLTLFFALFFYRRLLIVIAFNSRKNKNTLIYGFLKRLALSVNRVTYKDVIWLLLYSMLFQSSELFIFYILAQGFHLNIPFSMILLYLPLVMLLSNLPITVSGLGLREALIILFFLSYSSREDLLGFGFLVSFFEHILPILIGLIFLIPFIYKLKQDKINFSK